MQFVAPQGCFDADGLWNTDVAGKPLVSFACFSVPTPALSYAIRVYLVILVTDTAGGMPTGAQNSIVHLVQPVSGGSAESVGFRGQVQGGDETASTSAFVPFAGLLRTVTPD